MEATVNLEAYAGREFRATVERVIPIVTFNAGGPETKTPVRPLGTGTPEWPATFTVRLHLEGCHRRQACPGDDRIYQASGPSSQIAGRPP